MKTDERKYPIRYYLFLAFFTFSIILIVLLGVGSVGAFSTKIKPREQWAFPDVPRVSAMEAYVKFKTGKAILIQAEGQPFKLRHPQGAAFGIPTHNISKVKRLPKLPKRGVEIFTYCY